jgi:hypothetical protein
MNRHDTFRKAADLPSQAIVAACEAAKLARLQGNLWNGERRDLEPAASGVTGRDGGDDA